VYAKMKGRIIRRIIYVFLTLGLAVAGAQARADALFVDNFDKGLGNWEHVGDGEINIVEDRTAPAFGPEVLRLENSGASSCIAYLNDLLFTDGVITYLLKDMDMDRGLEFDCDGPGFARLSQEKELIPINSAFPTGYTIELDLDAGFHIIWGDNGDGGDIVINANIKTPGKWTWVKFSLMGDELKGKTWPAGREEPAKWQLEGKDKRYSEGAVAMRVWSGIMHLSHIRINDRDEPYIAVQPGAGKLAVTWGAMKE
jgi:hypothetical protein